MSTYSPIASQTLSANATSITFNGIPQNYTDLVIVFKGGSTAGVGLNLRFNGDSGANYARAYFYTTGAAPVSGRETSTTQISSSVFNENGNTIFNINGYSNSTGSKLVLGMNDYYSNGAVRFVGTWRNTAPITSITLSVDTDNISSGTVVSLYGLAGGQVAAKASGGIITTSGAYTYHTFKTSSSFTPNVDMTVDYLVVGGGGGAGAGGGGAGGLRSTVTATGGGGTLETPLSLTAGVTYPAVVGAGGIGGLAYGFNPNSNGTNGTYSAFNTIYSLGGGGGGSAGGGTGNPLQGGSGGGASYSSGKAYSGLGTANQGFNGGEDTEDNPPYVGPGGGGAGQVGQNPPNGSTAGAGGYGVQITALATPTSTGANSGYYAGGGGGYGYGGGTAGAGGLGGGGAGANNPGTANTGGGGGAAANGARGGQGGSGIVIVRYLS